jgi:hypothetical protein
LHRHQIGWEPVGARVRHFKRSVRPLVRIVLVWLISSAASAHPGWLDRYGGHSDRRISFSHRGDDVLATLSVQS